MAGTNGVDAAKFRELCGRFATGVVVVTATDEAGDPAGMTANSFTSVSLDPPMVSVNVDQSAEFHRVIEQAATFTIQILGNDQEALARRFAAPGNRFAGLGRGGASGEGLRLAGAIAVLECETVQRITAGDHTIVIGRVTGGEAHDDRPLLYFRGGYHSLA